MHAKYRLLLALLMVMMPLIQSNQVQASIEIVIEGNGAGSSNQSSAQSNQTTNVDQQNQGQMANEVVVNSTTGDNQAGNNSGDVVVQTGNIETEVDVGNQSGVNEAQVGCDCEQSGQIAIIGNGSDSQNTVDYSQSNQIGVWQNNQTNITTIITGVSNTGKNTAHNNGGDVVITTGGIIVKTSVDTLAGSNMAAVGGGGFTQTLNIKGNGVGSENLIWAEDESSLVVEQYNQAVVDNLIAFDLNTGKNEAEGNEGLVTLTTGDVEVSIDIDTKVNQNEVEVDNDCETKEEEPTPEPTEPKVPPTEVGGLGNGSGSGSSAAGNGAVGNGGAVGGDGGLLLPETGSSLLFVFLINIALLLLGCYLRLRSGRAPAIAIA